MQNPGSGRGKSSALRGKRLFLDLNGHKGLAALETNLKRLGAVNFIINLKTFHGC